MQVKHAEETGKSLSFLYTVVSGASGPPDAQLSWSTQVNSTNRSAHMQVWPITMPIAIQLPDTTHSLLIHVLQPQDCYRVCMGNLCKNANYCHSYARKSLQANRWPHAPPHAALCPAPRARGDFYSVRWKAGDKASQGMSTLQLDTCGWPMPVIQPLGLS